MSGAVVRALAWVGAVALLVAASIGFGRELAISQYLAAQHRAEVRAVLLSDSLRAAIAQVRVDSV